MCEREGGREVVVVGWQEPNERDRERAVSAIPVLMHTLRREKCQRKVGEVRTV